MRVVKVIKQLQRHSPFVDERRNSPVVPFGSIGSEIGKHGELKELETAIMGTYRQRVCDLNLQSEDVNPKTSAGKQLLSKFLRAQTMQDLAMALSATKDEKWMTIRMKLGLPEMEDFTPNFVGDEMGSIVLFFEKLLRSISYPEMAHT
eukprot:Em0432g3a